MFYYYIQNIYKMIYEKFNIFIFSAWLWFSDIFTFILESIFKKLFIINSLYWVIQYFYLECMIMRMNLQLKF